ncbi:Retrovirus-related Pol polyprotein [Aphis craccivora]|uniref:Retrovirus-related Pol polyprotein n=1 Tax=Aphis craccivora TaxID=307492 RepID=A0A6G0W4D7_APHCR|nr:Retrovirus-related Pol polyprotein [Aphis craccivora]
MFRIATAKDVAETINPVLQVPLSEVSKAKTAFITPTETGQFKRIMFELNNAQFVFSKLMNKVLG